MPTIFLSHSSRDKRFVRRLARGMRAYGVEVWLDEIELTIGQSVRERIRRAVETADYLVVAVSRQALKSSWVREEIAIAAEIGESLGRSLLRPILVEPMEEAALSELLGDRLYADFSDDARFEGTLALLLRSIGHLESVNDLIDELDDLPSFRPHSNEQVQAGRLLVQDICDHDDMEVPPFREWLYWELVKAYFPEGHVVDATVGLREGRELSCKVRDRWQGCEIEMKIALEQAERGIWEGEPTVFGRVTLAEEHEPFVAAEKFATHFGVPDGQREVGNPVPLEIPDTLRELRDISLGWLRGADDAVASSALWDLHHIITGLPGRPLTLMAGIVHYRPPEALRGSPFCAFQAGPRERACDRSGQGVLYMQIRDEFYATTQAVYLCRVHRQRLWRTRFDLLRNETCATGLTEASDDPEE